MDDGSSMLLMLIKELSNIPVVGRSFIVAVFHATNKLMLMHC